MNVRDYILSALLISGAIFVANGENELASGHRCTRSAEKVLARFSKDEMLHVRKRRETLDDTSKDILDAIKEIEDLQRRLYEIKSQETDSEQQISLKNIVKQDNEELGLSEERYEEFKFLSEELEGKLKDFCDQVGYKDRPAKRCRRKYRTIDGVCNNVRHPNWGRAGYPFRRFLRAQYQDGISQPRYYSHTARNVSAQFVKNGEGGCSTHGASELVMHFGQFLDHDINLTPTSTAECACGDDNDEELCFSIPCHEGDNLCEEDSCIKFHRSRPTISGNCKPGPRAHENMITSFVDASNVYGSFPEDAEYLRNKAKGEGQMKVDKLVFDEEHINFLPPDRENEECFLPGDEIHCGKGGDVRAAEQPGLTSIHTVFVREHNRIATVLHAFNPRWKEERLYQETRRIIIALMQKIVYGEFLPIVLGKETMNKYRLGLWDGYKGYQRKVNPTLFNDFATSFMRFGHSMVPEKLHRVTSLHEGEDHPTVELRSAFFNAGPVYEVEYGAISSLMLGMIDTALLPVDPFFSESITRHLFEHPEDRTGGLDLIALNIQRGRDHGLPPYVDYRRACKLPVPETWDDLTNIAGINEDTVEDLQKVYDSVDEIDAFVGYISEPPKEGALVGETAACILGKQFRNLKYGDRYWYENSKGVQAFSKDQLEAIQKVTFARLICENIRVESIQPAVFKLPDKTPEDDEENFGRKFIRYFYKLILKRGYPDKYGQLNHFKNRLVKCSDFDAIPELSLKPWAEDCNNEKDDDDDEKDESRPSKNGRKKDNQTDKEEDNERDNEKGKGKDKDKERGKEKDKERGKEKSRKKDKENDKEKDKERGKGKDEEKVKGKGKDKDKERGKEKDKETGKEKDKERGKEKSKKKDKENDNEKDKERGKAKDEEKGKDKERGKEKDKERGKEKDKERGKEKEKETETGQKRDKEKDEEKYKKKAARKAAKKAKDLPFP